MYVQDCVVINAQRDGQDITGLTASANGDKIDVSTYLELLAFLDVTANSGTTPTLDVKFQTSVDGVKWVDLPSEAFTQVTTVNSLTLRRLASNFGKFIRPVFTLGGTSPNYTFTLKLIGKR